MASMRYVRGDAGGSGQGRRGGRSNRWTLPGRASDRGRRGRGGRGRFSGRLAISEKHGWIEYQSYDVDVHDGRSEVLRTSERATTLVLHDGDKV